MARKERVRHSRGYWLLYRVEHPWANHDGYVPEHRLVMEDVLNTYPNPEKLHVHHIDGNKVNNKRENLMVVTPIDHNRIEKGWKKIDGVWWKTCRRCKRFLNFDTNFYRRGGTTSDPSVSVCIDCTKDIHRIKVMHRLKGKKNKK